MMRLDKGYIKDWFRHALRQNEYNVDNIKNLHMYRKFQDDTGSTASYQSYCRRVYEALNNMKLEGKVSEEYRHGSSRKNTNGYEDPEQDFSESARPGDSSFYQDEDGEYHAAGTVTEIKDAEEILEDWGISTEKWGVEDFKIGQQQVYAKGKYGQIKWGESDGKIAAGSSVQYTGIEKDVLYHIKMKLYRKSLPVEFEPIKPVQISVTPTGSPIPDSASSYPFQTAVVIGDAQIGYLRNERTGKLSPYHDRKALDIAVQVVNWVKPDKVIILGDMLDLPELSDKFIVMPELERTIQPALNELAWWLSQMVSAAKENTQFIYMEGNHEQRLPRILAKHQKSQLGIRRVDNLEGFPVISVPYWLALDQLGFGWLGDYPNDRFWLNDGLCASHGYKTKPDQLLRKINHIEIVGHYHRKFKQIETTQERRRTRFSGIVSFGMLSKMDDSVPANGTDQNWQAGLGVVSYNAEDPFDTAPDIQDIHIHNGFALFQGALFQGRERVDEIAQDINWKGYK